MAGKYATSTSVRSSQSRGELEDILSKYGATDYAYVARTTEAVIAFRMHEVNIRFTLPLPDKNADEFRLTPSKKWERSDEEWARAYEQAVRSSWRSLLLVVKAKLEAIETGIVTFEQEFYAHLVLPSGRTIFEETHEQVRTALESNIKTFRLEIEG